MVRLAFIAASLLCSGAASACTETVQFQFEEKLGLPKGGMIWDRGYTHFRGEVTKVRDIGFLSKLVEFSVLQNVGGGVFLGERLIVITSFGCGAVVEEGDVGYFVAIFKDGIFQLAGR